MSTVKVLHKNIVLQKKNRLVKHSVEKITQRAASILEIGILQNIVVSSLENGQFLLEAGEGRYLSVAHLIKTGQVADDYEYEARLIPAGSSAIIRTVENTHREQLHIADKFLSYKDALDEGKTVKEIANFNGVSEKKVSQYLQLAALSPVIMTALIENTISYKAAQLYSNEPDKERQENAFIALGSMCNSTHQIRNMLFSEKISIEDPVYKFASSEYEKSGGAVVATLFGDDSFIADENLLRTVALKKLTIQSKKLLKDGWAWTDIVLDDVYFSAREYTCIPHDELAVPEVLSEKIALMQSEYDGLYELDETTDDQDDRMTYLETMIDGLKDTFKNYHVFPDAVKPFAGCILGFNETGHLVIQKGLVKEINLDDYAIFSGEKTETSDTITNKNSGGSVEGSGYSKALECDFKNTKSAILMNALLSSPSYVYDLVVFQFAESILRAGAAGYSTPALGLSLTKNGLQGADESCAVSFDRFKSKLNRTWAVGDQMERFSRFIELTKEEKSSILTYCALATLNSDVIVSQADSLSAVIAKAEVNYREFWLPSRAWFIRFSKSELLSVIDDIFGKETPPNLADAKKTVLADFLDKSFKDSTGFSEQTRRNLTQWLPKVF